MEKLLLKIAVCDDNASAREDITKKLRESSFCPVIDQYMSGDDLLRQGVIYDIIFLDVEMPGTNGIVTAKQLRKSGRNDLLIFLTSYEQFMADAFSVKAFRYLLKPVSQAAIYSVLQDAYNEISTYQKIAIPLPDNEGVTTRPLETVCMIESLGDNSCVYTDTENIISSKSLKYWESVLDSGVFYRVSKEHIISLRHVSELRNNYICFDAREERVRVPRRMRKKFQVVWMTYVRFHAVPR